MIKDGNLFCDKCGKKLSSGETICPDCGAPTSSSNRIQKTSHFNLCSVLSVAVLIFGIVGSIYLAYRFGVKVESLYDVWNKDYKYETVRDIASTIIIFVSGAFGTLILYAILSALGDIKEKLSELR